MNRLKIVLVLLLGIFLVPASVMAADPNEPDHSHTYYGCDGCHTPHKADVLTGVPLWNGNATTQTFTLYDSATTQASVEQPRGASKLCLSCHDGLSAQDPNATEGVQHYGWMYGDSVFGNDLSVHHPISFDYDAVASADAEIIASDVARTQLGGGTIAQHMLDETKYMECSSCHDIHEGAVLPNNLRVANASGPDGGQLCKTCHAK
jgi:predicted CXXCH cytochrome family protein